MKEIILKQETGHYGFRSRRLKFRAQDGQLMVEIYDHDTGNRIINYLSDIVLVDAQARELAQWIIDNTGY